MARRIHYERLVVGYHGCDRKTGEQVLVEGKGVRPSHNKYDWLGRGIYFWEHGPERALDWAREQQVRGKIEEPRVLGAYIHLGRCLDLTDTAATTQLRAWHDDLEEAMVLAAQVMPENKPAGDGDHDLLLRFLDCAVLNFGLDDMDREEGRTVYQTVRGVFVEGAPAYEGARIMTKTHVQITVRDPDCILGYFRPADQYGVKRGGRDEQRPERRPRPNSRPGSCSLPGAFAREEGRTTQGSRNPRPRGAPQQSIWRRG